MEVPKIRKLEGKGEIEIDLRVGRGDSAWGSGPELASGLISVTEENDSYFLDENSESFLVERRQRK